MGFWDNIPGAKPVTENTDAVFGDGAKPVQITDEQTVSPSDRFKLKNFGNSDPEQERKYLESKGYHVVRESDGSYRFAPPDAYGNPTARYGVIDPEGFDLQDVTDIGGDVAVGAVGAAGAAGGSMVPGVGTYVGGGLATGLAETGRQAIGKKLGVNQELDGTQIGLQTALGAVPWGKVPGVRKVGDMLESGAKKVGHMLVPDNLAAHAASKESADQIISLVQHSGIKGVNQIRASFDDKIAEVESLLDVLNNPSKWTGGDIKRWKTDFELDNLSKLNEELNMLRQAKGVWDQVALEYGKHPGTKGVYDVLSGLLGAGGALKTLGLTGDLITTGLAGTVGAGLGIVVKKAATSNPARVKAAQIVTSSSPLARALNPFEVAARTTVGAVAGSVESDTSEDNSNAAYIEALDGYSSDTRSSTSTPFALPAKRKEVIDLSHPWDNITRSKSKK